MIVDILIIVLGLAAIFRADAIARRSRKFVDSGKELYFEQRRSWEAYPWTRPPTEPGRVKRVGWVFVAIGCFLLLNSALFDWSL
jgi:hypothetical protein